MQHFSIKIASSVSLQKLLRPCQGHCYDSTEIISYFCQGYPGCQLLDYYRCYVERTCTGVWIPIEIFTPCSATCGGGTQTIVAVCKDTTTGWLKTLTEFELYHFQPRAFLPFSIAIIY